MNAKGNTSTLPRQLSLQFVYHKYNNLPMASNDSALTSMAFDANTRQDVSTSLVKVNTKYLVSLERVTFIIKFLFDDFESLLHAFGFSAPSYHDDNGIFSSQVFKNDGHTKVGLLVSADPALTIKRMMWLKVLSRLSSVRQ